MTESFFLISIVLLLAGVAMYFIADKDRNAENGELPLLLQWSYLFIFIGFFLILTKWISFTAILLIFLIITSISWIVFKIVKSKNKENKLFLYDNKWNLIDFLQGFFVIILIVFIVRTFLFEPFMIPSSSMRPNLIPNDFILVNKYTYGIRIPIINNVIIPINKVQRGDVMVFNKYIDNVHSGAKNLNYIKRVIGIPGDNVSYRNKILKINGNIIHDKFISKDSYINDKRIDRKEVNNKVVTIDVDKYSEKFGNKIIEIFINPKEQGFYIELVKIRNQNCKYFDDGIECTIPENKYLMMGDNRDNSFDGRYFGFVDDKEIVGKALLVWMNIHDLKRIAKIIK